MRVKSTLLTVETCPVHDKNEELWRQLLCRDVQGQHTIAESMNGVGPLRLCATEATPEDFESRRRKVASLLP